MRQTYVLPLLLLAACSSGDEPSAPGGVTDSEAAALNDAAAMLDANSVDANVLTAQQKEPR
ncbi:hypothetical protein [Sphingomonas sp. Leaf62]|uniref:hypothetical protein n=1 Tax=Sphingomonas sp. Leaf62 TaxID=1736228 RepID=UPI0006F95E2F|nr:hypothetical protein [Sphingomonas sp. Leaf62]KQN78529.1 hypothetical protein ASE91_14005 [Sphingomonas sp. Leaf62]